MAVITLVEAKMIKDTAVEDGVIRIIAVVVSDNGLILFVQLMPLSPLAQEQLYSNVLAV